VKIAIVRPKCAAQRSRSKDSPAMCSQFAAIAAVMVYARPMNELLKRITIRSEQCHGQPCIRGMRIRVIDVLEMLAAGMTHTEIPADYPYLPGGNIIGRKASFQAECYRTGTGEPVFIESACDANRIL
jgi:uncharacterized protein (DUF433 family)